MVAPQSIDPAMALASRLLTTPPPALDEADAGAILEAHYGLHGRVTALAAERDANFLVELADGSRRVLKIYNEIDDAPTRDFQNGVLMHMERRRVACPVPRLHRTQEDRAECTVEIDGQLRHAILISFVPGVSASLEPPTPALRRSLGRACAAIAVALEDFTHPVSDRVLLWDLMQVSQLKAFAAAIEHSARRRWLEAFIERFTGEIAPATRALPWQVIHNDLSGSNVFVHADDAACVSGVIDFGDVVRAPRINELAVTASYFIGDDDPATSIGEVLEGYEALAPLTEPEVALIYDLVLARLAIRVLIPEWRAALFPENRDYILRNIPAGWRLIDRLAGQDPRAARNAILQRWTRGRAA